MKIHEVTNKQNKGKDEGGRNFTLVGGFNPCGLISNVHQVAHLPRTKWTTPPKKKKKKHETTINIYWLTFWTSFIGQFAPPFQTNPTRHHSPLWRSALSFETVVPCAARFHAPEFFFERCERPVFSMFLLAKNHVRVTCLYMYICTNMYLIIYLYNESIPYSMNHYEI